jgi:hypothetical protein
MSKKACHDRHRPYHNTFALAAHAPGGWWEARGGWGPMRPQRASLSLTKGRSTVPALAARLAVRSGERRPERG